MTKNRFIVIIFPVYWVRIAGWWPVSKASALLALNSINVSPEQSGFWKEARYLTCYRRVLLYWPIFNAIIPELFIKLAQCDALPPLPEPQRLHGCHSPASFCRILLFHQETDTAFPQDTNIKSAYFSPCGAIFSLRLSDLLTRHRFPTTCFLPPHTHTHTRPLTAPAFMYAAQDSQRVHTWSTWTHAVLSISTTNTFSFSSCAGGKGPHPFLMHSHMVVLFVCVCRGQINGPNNAEKISNLCHKCFQLHQTVVHNISSASQIDPITWYWPAAKFYSGPSGGVFDAGDEPSMWGDIQSSSDGWPALFMSRVVLRDDIFNASTANVFFTPEMLASDWATRHEGHAVRGRGSWHVWLPSH